MLKVLKKKLPEAEGRSEFIVAVFCDIRGFSTFSTQHDSSDTAMFIKRFYVKLLNEYFPGAVFAKPTGDGLLIVYRYKEKTLQSTSRDVLEGCFRVLGDYTTMFQDDPMINYDIPGSIGFGISRGSACCLFSGNTILDYSGALLNLAARLNDYARPSGVVVDGNYLIEVIPDEYREVFSVKSVYVRGIAEKEAVSVLCSSEVELPGYALTPIQASTLKQVEKNFSVSDLLSLSVWYNITLPTEPDVRALPVVEFVWPLKKPKGHLRWRVVNKVEVQKRAEGWVVRLNVGEVHAIIQQEKLAQRTKVKLRVQYASKEPTASQGGK